MTYGFTVSPSSTAFLARSAAATITDGFEVFVQLVMAAMTTQPFSTLASCLACTATVARPSTGPPSSVSRDIASGSGLGPGLKTVLKLLHTSGSDTRSCGRLGPATLDSTLLRSSSSSSLNFGVTEPSTRNSPCSFVYRSTSSICERSRPVTSR